MKARCHQARGWAPSHPGGGGHGGDHYRFGIPRHLHEGGVLKEPELGGGDGAVLPDGHGRGGWRERSQGLVTWGGGAAMSWGEPPLSLHCHGSAVLTASPHPPVSPSMRVFPRGGQNMGCAGPAPGWKGTGRGHTAGSSRVPLTVELFTRFNLRLFPQQGWGRDRRLVALWVGRWHGTGDK